MFIFYTSDIPENINNAKVSFADVFSHVTKMLQKLLKTCNNICMISKKWHRRYRINIDEAKSVQVPLKTMKKTCPPVEMFGKDISIDTKAEYLGQRLTWKYHL